MYGTNPITQAAPNTWDVCHLTWQRLKGPGRAHPVISEEGTLSPDFKESPQITGRGKGTADHEKESKTRKKH